MRRIIEHHFDLPAVIDFPDTDDSLIPAQIHNLLHHPLQNCGVSPSYRLIEKSEEN
jgi:hypothetical protein